MFEMQCEVTCNMRVVLLSKIVDNLMECYVCIKMLISRHKSFTITKYYKMIKLTFNSHVVKKSFDLAQFKYKLTQ